MTWLPQTIALHLGAHKTASTHLQRSLAAVPLKDVRVFGPPDLRGKGQSIPERFGFPLDPGSARSTPEPIEETLREMVQGASRLILSDETFAGKLQTGWGRIPTPLYRTSPGRIERLVAAVQTARGPELDLFLGIRDPAEYLTSTYSQILHGGRVVRPEKFQQKNAIEGVDWADYVARLRSIAGIRRLTVWRYEDYADLFSEITLHLTGSKTITPHPDRAQPRLSQEALNEVLIAKALREKNSVVDAARRFPVSHTNPPMALFPAEARAASKALYEKQWSTICAHPNVTALRL